MKPIYIILLILALGISFTGISLYHDTQPRPIVSWDGDAWAEREQAIVPKLKVCYEAIQISVDEYTTKCNDETLLPMIAEQHMELNKVISRYNDETSDTFITDSFSSEDIGEAALTATKLNAAYIAAILEYLNRYEQEVIQQ